MEIVGVVENSRHGTVDEVVKDFVYEPYMQSAQTGPIFLYVRTQIDPDALMPSIRGAVQQVDPALPVVGLKTLQTQIEESVFLERMLTRLTVIFGSLAIVLATLGIYGVMSYV